MLTFIVTAFLRYCFSLMIFGAFGFIVGGPILGAIGLICGLPVLS